MNDLKFPIIYKFQCKRGNSFEERKIELSENLFRYINPKNNEERIKAKIEDCVLTEFSANVPNTLRLFSVSNSFNEVIIRHINGDIIKKFKAEFDLIISKKKLLNKLERIDVVLPQKTPVIKDEEFYEAKSSGEEEADFVKSRSNENQFNQMRNPVSKEPPNSERKTDEISYSAVNQITFEDNKDNSLQDNKLNKEESQKNIDSFRNPSVTENTGRNSLDNSNIVNEESKVNEATHTIEEDYSIKVEYAENLLSNTLSEKVNQILEDKYYKFNFNKTSVVEINDSEFRSKYETQSFSIKLEEKVSNLIEVIKRDMTVYKITISILIVFNLIIVFLYSKYLTIIMGSISFYMLIFAKRKNKLETVSNTNLPSNVIDYFDLSLKITGFVECNDIKHIIYHLNNLEEYREWNHSVEVSQHKNKLFTYIYYGRDNQKFEIANLQRRFVCNLEQTKYLLVEYFDESRVYKVIVIDSTNKQKTKLTTYVSVKQAPKFYLKSIFKSLDNFSIFLSLKNIDVENTKKIEFPTLRNSEIINNSNDIKRPRDSLSRASISDNNIQTNENEHQNLSFIKENKNNLNLISTYQHQKLSIDSESGIKNPFPDKPEIKGESKIEENRTPTENQSKDIENKIKTELNSEDKTLIEMYENKLKLFKQFKERDWKIWEEKKDYQVYYVDEQSGLRSIKSEITVNKPLKTIYDFLTIFENKGKYDKNYDTGNIIKTIEDSYSLQYHKYKGKLGVAPRDMTVIVKKIFDSENESMILATSFVSEQHPRINKIERADLYYGGFVLKKIDENNTLLQFYSCTDLKLAQWMVNMTLKEVAMCVVNIRDLLSR